MADEKKTPEEETAEGKPTEEQNEPQKPKEKPSEEKPTDEEQVEENGEGATEETPEAPPEEKEEEAEAAPPELSEEDKLREENFRLKTQLEAIKIGFVPDVIEDAVILAENIVKRDGLDISAALQAVAKKYPDWKADSKGKESKSKGGFRVGADSSGQSSASDEKINKAFGLKKKG